MSLELKFTSYTSVDGTKLYFQDITGVYNASTNNTGWGSPNVDISTATSASLEIYFPGEDESITLDINASTPSYPTEDTSLTAEFDMSSFEGEAGDIFPDGVYQFIYTVVANGETYITTKYIFSYSQVKCCVESMFVDLNPNDCNGGCLEAAEDAILVWAYYKSLIANATCGNITKANEKLDFVNKLCSGSGNCTNC